MRLIIAGSRKIKATDENLDKIIPWLDTLTQNTKPTAILNGCCEGVDEIGHMYAVIRQIPEWEFPADWNTFGNPAGPIRNEKMAMNADALALIWNGKSTGSANMLKNAKKYGLKIRQLIIEI